MQYSMNRRNVTTGVAIRLRYKSFVTLNAGGVSTVWSHQLNTAAYTQQGRRHKIESGGGPLKKCAQSALEIF